MTCILFDSYDYAISYAWRQIRLHLYDHYYVSTILNSDMRAKAGRFAVILWKDEQ